MKSLRLGQMIKCDIEVRWILHLVKIERRITSKLSKRPFKDAVQKTARGKILNPQYSTDRDQPTSRASPLRINDLLSTALGNSNHFGIWEMTFLVNCILTFDFDVVGSHPCVRACLIRSQTVFGVIEIAWSRSNSG